MKYLSLAALASILLTGCHGSLNLSSPKELTMAPFQKSAVTLVAAMPKKTNAITFQQLSGKLVMQGDKPTSMDVSIQMASIATSDAKLGAKLMDKTNFDVQKFPVTSFHGQQFQVVKGTDKNPDTYEIGGEVIIKEKKFPVHVPASIVVTPEDVAVSFQLSIGKDIWKTADLGEASELFSNNLDIQAKLVFPQPKAK
jgi:polyisoprenoid-binding protein YceI